MLVPETNLHADRNLTKRNHIFVALSALGTNSEHAQPTSTSPQKFDVRVMRHLSVAPPLCISGSCLIKLLS